MTGPDGLPDDVAAWPVHVPSPAVLGQVELQLAGIHGPAWVTVDVPASVGDASAEAGHLVLADEEGTPLAHLTVENVSPGPDGATARVAGPVGALRPFHAGPFGALRRQPDEVRDELAGGAAVGIALDRPLTAAEERALADAAARRGARLLVLPCVADTGPSGLPPEILVRAVRASLPRLATPAGAALLVPLPLVPEADAAAPPGAGEFVHAAGGAMLDEAVLDPTGWTPIRSALDAGPGAVEEIVAADVAAVLRAWRPVRSQRGLTVFFTGLSGSGKSTLARGLTNALLERGRTVTLVDGDAARRLLSSGLGFGRADRDLNIRRIGWVASEVTRHGGVAVCAPIAPFAASRAEVRRMVEANGDFVLVHVATPLAVCEQRDRKGLYAQARAGVIPEFTGISDPYEVPEDAHVRVDTSTMPVDDAVDVILSHLERGGWLG
ncbi:MAG TPA: adenylyl-sulfate kinase [Jiangellaceae bacterium]|nr:adenylyl-sulfate kinase [Jiangellaceae bacterium]